MNGVKTKIKKEDIVAWVCNIFSVVVEGGEYFTALMNTQLKVAFLCFATVISCCTIKLS